MLDGADLDAVFTVSLPSWRARTLQEECQGWTATQATQLLPSLFLLRNQTLLLLARAWGIASKQRSSN